MLYIVVTTPPPVNFSKRSKGIKPARVCLVEVITLPPTTDELVEGLGGYKSHLLPWLLVLLFEDRRCITVPLPLLKFCSREPSLLLGWYWGVFIGGGLGSACLRVVLMREAAKSIDCDT